MKDDNTLFNQSRMDSYLKKYKKEFKLTNSQKEAVIKWNKKLKDGELKKEESNYINFALNILVNLLEYDPDTDFEQEVKMGRGFADFVIKKDGKNFIVGELKGSDADLDKRQAGRPGEMSAVEQGFFYANKEGIKWIIVSNYNEFRLYNRNIGEDKFIKFKIDELKDDHEKLKSFLLTFSRFSILEKKLIDKLASKTQFVDRDFENEFYKLYNETRLMLIAEIEHLHSDFTRDKSVKYAQLILNRYIFICFAEDIGLLPGEISVETIENATKNKSSLGRNGIWYGLNNLFLDINEGNKENEAREYEIFGYNGGLFSKDLGFLKIRDFIDDHSIFEDTYQNWNFKDYYSIVENKLGSTITKINPIYKNLMTISTFNFKSEVDVNILGHIFENSIGDLEELKADSKGRKKQEGIFYTPEHITDYICRNTIIPYLSEKESKNVEELINEYSNVGKIDELQYKLMNITIIDPACGSGAFLNKASDILLEIHHAIYEYKKEIQRVTIKTKGGKGKSKIKTDAEHIILDSYFDRAKNRRKILENNIYGVDLNEESVEITKLALFLKIAQKDKKLPSINKNIKCGNSLIDDPKYTNKPFKWEDEFNDIFDKGGFDIVIGNPPYVVLSSTKNREFGYLQNKFVTAYGRLNTFALFIEQTCYLINENGKVGLIIPDSLCLIDYYTKLREFILKNYSLEYLIELGDGIFEDATVPALIIIFGKSYTDLLIKIGGKEVIENPKCFKFIEQDNFLKTPKNSYNLHMDELSFKINNLIDYKKVFPLKELIEIKIGVCTGGNNKHISYKPKFKNSKKVLRGKNIGRFNLSFNNEYLNYDKNQLLRSRNEDIFLKKEKLLMRQTSDKLILTYDNDQYYTIDSLFILYPKRPDIDLKYILCLLNSKLINRQYQKLNPEAGRVFAQVKIDYVNEIPIILTNKNLESVFIQKADHLISLNKKLNTTINSFKKYLKIYYNVEKFSKNLENYYKHSEKTLFSELRKIKVKLTTDNIMELSEEFENVMKKITPLLQEIKKTDDEIDQMVFDLYGLTDDEIEIIENSLKN